MNDGYLDIRPSLIYSEEDWDWIGENSWISEGGSGG